MKALHYLQVVRTENTVIVHHEVMVKCTTVQLSWGILHSNQQEHWVKLYIPHYLTCTSHEGEKTLKIYFYVKQRNDKYHDITYMWNLKKMIQMNLFTEQK